MKTRTIIKGWIDALTYLFTAIIEPPLAQEKPPQREASHNCGANGGWFTLPGQRIELGTTGFQIVLVGQRNVPAYRLVDPEGTVRAAHDELPRVKAYAEQLAGWRALLEHDPEESAALAEALRRIAAGSAR